MGVDGRPANTSERAGIGNYCRGLLEALGRRDDLSLRVYLDRAAGPHFPLDEPAAEIRALPACRFWTFRRLAGELRRDPPSVFVSSTIQLPPRPPCPSIATVHDLAFMTFPRHFDAKRRFISPWRARLAVRCATHLIADSEATRTDLIRLLNVDIERISVVYPGCSPSFRPDDDAETLARVREACRLPERYFLYVGQLQPRKNLVRLIQAFTGFREEHPGSPHELVIAGGGGWLHKEIYEAAERSPARDSIRFTGFVADADLPALVSQADALVLVSLWEGFGLPVLEAMASGTAVITSNCSSLPEVAGDAGLLVDPYDVDAIQKALAQVACDAALRKTLEKKGVARARLFSWDTAAERIAAIAAGLVAQR